MENVEIDLSSPIILRLVLQTSVPPEKASSHRDPKVLAELQSQEVLPRHQERILPAPGCHPLPGSDRQVAGGARDDGETAGSL